MKSKISILLMQNRNKLFVLLVVVVASISYVFLNFDVPRILRDSMKQVGASEPVYDFYVSPSGSDSNVGTSLKPLKTIQKALQLAQPGKSIFLMPGKYMQDVISVRDGTESAPIKIIGNQDVIVSGGGNSRIVEINHDHITLSGFTIDGLFGASTSASGYRDMLVYAVGKEKNNGVTGLKILNMNLKNAGGECVRMKYFAQKNEVADSTIQNCGVYDFRFSGGGKNGEGIYIGTAPEQLSKNPTAEIDRSNNNYIHNNIITTNGNEGVDIKEGSSENIIEYNKISGQKDPDSGGLDSRGDGNIFRYNEVSGSAGAGIRFGGDKYNSVQYGKNNQAYGNKLTSNKYGAFKVQASPQGKICGNILSSNGTQYGDYGSGINFTDTCSNVADDDGVSGLPVIDSSEIKALAIEASSYDIRDGGYIPENSCDGSLGTRWSALGLGSWIQYDLGSSKTLCSAKIAFYRGNLRQDKFYVDVSEDGKIWKRVLVSQSSGTTTSEQNFDFEDTQARYVRLIGNGNTENKWFSLTEVKLIGA